MISNRNWNILILTNKIFSGKEVNRNLGEEESIPDIEKYFLVNNQQLSLVYPWY